jgi:hypothetical protein
MTRSIPTARLLEKHSSFDRAPTGSEFTVHVVQVEEHP